MLRYFSPCNNVYLSYIILYTIFPLNSYTRLQCNYVRFFVPSRVSDYSVQTYDDWLGKYLEKSGRGLCEAPALNMHGQTEKGHE